jgi:hypothetical protein
MNGKILFEFGAEESRLHIYSAAGMAWYAELRIWDG